MERLTEKISNGTKPKTLRGLIRWFVTHNGIRKDVIIGEYNKLYDRLVEYEDLGIPPEQLQEILANNLDPIEMCKVSIALAKLKEYQEAEKQGLLLRLHWHKVAEGDLPNHTNRVLVYIKYKASDRIPPHCVANYAGGKWWYPSDREIAGEARVIAWMELPEYEEEKNG